VDIGSIDRSATGDLGWLHRTAPWAKLWAFALVLAAVVSSWNPFFVLAVALLLGGAAASSRLDLKLTLTLAAYPAVFALIFAVASAPDAVTTTVIVLKAVCAALAAVTVILSTPYPQVFAPVQRVVPGVVGDVLLMTYRSTFLLLEKFGNMLRAIRLRAGIRGVHPVQTARATTQALGGVLLYSLDLAQRDYDIMRLRGYSGRLRIARLRSRSPGGDIVLVFSAAMILSAGWILRLDSAVLNPFSWLLPLFAAPVAVVGMLVRRRAT
jgi:energy-coupling factor transporter transmembrane protein EcfT